MERREGYEKYVKSVGESLRVGAEVILIPTVKVAKEMKPVAKLMIYQHFTDRRLRRARKGV